MRPWPTTPVSTDIATTATHVRVDSGHIWSPACTSAAGRATTSPIGNTVAMKSVTPTVARARRLNAR